MRITQGQTLFGFHCTAVYRLSDPVLPWSPEWTGEVLRTEGAEANATGDPSPLIARHDSQVEASTEDSTLYCTLEPSDLRRLELCSRAFQEYIPETARGEGGSTNYGMVDTVCDSMSDLPLGSQIMLDGVDHFDEGAGFPLTIATASGLLYGGLHLLAWNAPFPSKVEQVLWRFSGIVCAISGLTVFGLMGVVDELLSMQARLTEQRTSSTRWLLQIRVWIVKSFTGSSLLLWACCCVAFTLARFYLVVECFLQLAHLPPSAYEVPEWSQYFPHIG